MIPLTGVTSYSETSYSGTPYSETSYSGTPYLETRLEGDGEGVSTKLKYETKGISLTCLVYQLISFPTRLLVVFFFCI